MSMIKIPTWYLEKYRLVSRVGKHFSINGLEILDDVSHPIDRLTFLANTLYTFLRA